MFFVSQKKTEIFKTMSINWRIQNFMKQIDWGRKSSTENFIKEKGERTIWYIKIKMNEKLKDKAKTE